MKNILLFLFLFVGLTLFAQNITWSPLSKEGKKSDDHHLIKIDDHSFLDAEENQENKGIELSLVKYNTQSLTEEERVDYDRKGKKRVYSNIMGVEKIGDKIYLFTERRAKDKKSTSFYSEEIDPVTLKTSNRKALLKVDFGKNPKFTYQMLGGSDMFSYSVSPNKSKIVVKLSFITDYKVAIFNEAMEKLWSRVIWDKYVDESLIGPIKIDDDGSVYFVTTFFDNNKQSLFLHTFMGDEENHQKYKISNRNLFLYYELALWSPEPGVYNVFSYYHKKSSSNKKKYRKKYKKENQKKLKYHGYFFQQINANDDITLDAQTIPFPKDYPYLGLTGWTKATRKMDERIAEGEGLLSALEIDQVFYDKSSGNSTISMEEYHVVVGHGKYTTYTYYYNQVAVLQLNKNGALNWHHAINKSQISNSGKTEYMSYAIAPLGNNFYIFFNDVKSNTKKRAENKKTARYKGKSGEVMSFKITNDGKMSKEKVHSFDKAIYPKFYRVDKDTQIIFAKDKIGKLKA